MMAQSYSDALIDHLKELAEFSRSQRLQEWSRVIEIYGSEVQYTSDRDHQITHRYVLLEPASLPPPMDGMLRISSLGGVGEGTGWCTLWDFWDTGVRPEGALLQPINVPGGSLVKVEARTRERHLLHLKVVLKGFETLEPLK